MRSGRKVAELTLTPVTPLLPFAQKNQGIAFAAEDIQALRPPDACRNGFQVLARFPGWRGVRMPSFKTGAKKSRPKGRPRVLGEDA
jgi:hypothetical protein